MATTERHPAPLARGQPGLHIWKSLRSQDMADVAMTALSEALRDRYVIEGELGRGGMGVVLLACNLRHNRLALRDGSEMQPNYHPQRFESPGESPATQAGIVRQRTCPLGLNA